MEDPGCAKPTAGIRANEPLCQVCGEPLRRRAVVQCRKCSTLHHLECWRFNKGCSMFACGSRSSMKPPNALDLAGADIFDIECRTLSGSALRPVAAFGVIFALGLLLSLVARQPAIAAAASLSLGGLLYFLLRHLSSRDLLHVDSKSGTIHRTVRAFGRVLKVQDRWMSADEIVEIHLHRIPHQHTGGFVEWKIFGLLADGRRQALYRETFNAALQNSEEIHAIAERLAVFADCTVRDFEGAAEPVPHEIQEAIAQRRMQRAESAPALPPVAEPAPPHPATLDPASEAGSPPAEEEPRGRVREGPR